MSIKYNRTHQTFVYAYDDGLVNASQKLFPEIQFTHACSTEPNNVEFGRDIATISDKSLGTLAQF